jgi:hypothetical protein
MKYRKKPVVIEAIELTWANWGAICDFVPKPWFERGVWLDEEGKPLPEGQTRFVDGEGALGLLINTTEGLMLGRGGEFIIKGVAGEFYPCKPDIFHTTYEPAE